jgi:hypothetical protein
MLSCHSLIKLFNKHIRFIYFVIKMSFYKKIGGESYYDLFGNLEIMSTPSTPNINDDKTTFNIANKSAKDINDKMDFKQSSTQDEFFSFINLNDNIEHMENNSDDNSSEMDSFDELIHIKDNEGKSRICIICLFNDNNKVFFL